MTLNTGTVGMSAKFQTAFPEDFPEERDPDVIMCRWGCGQPAKYGNLRPGLQGGDPPCCSGDPKTGRVSKGECPAIKGAALRAARRAGRLGRRWQSRF